MHAYLLPIVALVFCLPVASADESCACQFPNQMRGTIEIYMNEVEDRHPYFDLLQPSTSDFEVDFHAKLVHIWPEDKEVKGNSEYIQDLDNNIMYRFPFVDKGIKGPCTYIKLTEDIRLPNCLPAGWFIDSTYGGYDTFSDSNNSDYNWYNMRPNNLCQPVKFFLERRRNATTYVKTYARVKGYKLSTPINVTLNTLDTSSCTEASFESFIKIDDYK